jgi:predicted nucleotidyltransferase
MIRVVTMNRHNTESALQKVVRRLVKTVVPEQIILFGSVARGDEQADSDIDLLVVVPQEKLCYETTRRARQVLRGLPLKVDLCWTTPARLAEFRDVRWTIEESATREGRLLYDRSPVGTARSH